MEEMPIQKDMMLRSTYDADAYAAMQTSVLNVFTMQVWVELVNEAIEENDRATIALDQHLQAANRFTTLLRSRLQRYSITIGATMPGDWSCTKKLKGS
ncbi:hypothetical protein GUJ93_ZPchr0007g4009 [Zizania palustris]|uniref:Uncharacterized protein n=1 Tax=Zizania palustris TaxID=103762 RepID=A0A8J5VNR7_ZIZPA|nr:hypothetical protein GUJ93_ZPchr0007g4009 [Zizania palustris]